MNKGIGDSPMPLSCTIPGYNQQSRHYGEDNAGGVGGDEPLAGQQPFNTLPKLRTDAKQDLRPNLHLAVFHRGERVLADANAFGELRLRYIKAAHLPNATTFLIAGSLRADGRWSD